MSSKIYFLKGFEDLEVKIKDVLKNFYPAESAVTVKIHFGEPGNKFAFTPEDLEPVIRAMQSLKLRPLLIDTPVKYKSPRDSIKGYEKIVKQRGYERLAPFIISNKSKNIKTKDFIAGVCRELIEAENVLVVSHVKGHCCAGFGGAIKNLGMGGVDKKTKKIEHALGRPRFTAECRGCGTCAKLCPAGAIKMIKNKAKIDLKSCYGCSICELQCPYNCLVPEKACFDDLLAQAAAAVIKNLSKKTFYLNFIKNVTKFCDCEENPEGLVAEDIGMLFSDNPVAIDKASVDLINDSNKKDLFQEINHKDPLLHVTFAEKYTGKKTDYELIKI